MYLLSLILRPLTVVKFCQLAKVEDAVSATAFQQQLHHLRLVQWHVWPPHEFSYEGISLTTVVRMK